MFEAESKRWPPQELSRDVFYTNLTLIPFVLVCVVIVFTRYGLDIKTSTALLYAAGCLVSGAFFGFLFGIPRVIEPDVPGQASKNAEGAGTAAQAQYNQRVNTNLLDISDWLTKILVGLTLINLREIPPRLGEAAHALADGLDRKNMEGDFAFALGLIIAFAVVGFFMGYLYTRLFLAGAFSRADTARPGLQSKVEAIVQQSAAAQPQGGNITPEQVTASRQIARLSASEDDRKAAINRVEAYAKEYEKVRAEMPPGHERTLEMEALVAKMRSLAAAAYAELPRFLKGTSPGEKLVAVSMLQVEPDVRQLPWLLEQIDTEVPFIGYQAAIAIKQTAIQGGDEERSQVKDALTAWVNTPKGKAMMSSSTDRAEELKSALASAEVVVRESSNRKLN